MSAQWKQLPVNNEPPPARAYHSMTSIGSRHLLFGGFDGKTTFGDLWWLVPEGNVMAPYKLQCKRCGTILSEMKGDLTFFGPREYQKCPIYGYIIVISGIYLCQTIPFR